MLLVRSEMRSKTYIKTLETKSRQLFSIWVINKLREVCVCGVCVFGKADSFQVLQMQCSQPRQRIPEEQINNSTNKSSAYF
jgi:hypothetical protein